MSIRMIFSVLTIASLGAIAPWALAAGDAASAPMQATAPAAKGASFAEGEIKKIDVEQSKVTIKHGPIDNLGMPGMTMVFRADAATLSGFKVGDAVKFKADRVDGAIKVTELVAR
ncbi:copper-binding protein [Pelomonas aquatica]|jgi:Cu(I)/Ag(I) efflux system protein CusF|uniref:copper-binding protein n=2 Tax=Pseudomonadota TaxID=1224 RepID=UPI0016D38B59|nr:copper-binding protein [Pelomonas aquatica]MBY0365786.1 copper-binding protein [Burkholderiaceae bacterium]MCY4754293.1 copper-binding protein [Pelomonas aquatica]|mmetsp:Transcript_12856/g.30137  ORF Transcript_12856/g.30137 Transcript_12856/m.30137 type:complete len:115 (-) Transcript_12856:262-606(-)